MSPHIGDLSWVREIFRVNRAPFPVGHAIRSALAVGGPFIVGSATGHVITGMWIGLATLLLASGEREGTYRLNFVIIGVSAPIAALGYVVGYVADVPLAALILLLALLALLMGLLAGLGPGFSVGAMQFLLVASIAIGVPGIKNWWVPLGLYFVGAAIYAALLAVEMLVAPFRPRRVVAEPLLRSLATLARARASDLSDGGTRTEGAQAVAAEAYRSASARADEIGFRRDRAAGWTLNDDVVECAERVMTLLIGTRDPAAARAVADWLDGLADLVAGKPAGKAPTDGAGSADATTVGPLLTERMTALQRALTTPASQRPERAPAHSWSPAISGETVFAATRLALCFGIAVGARGYFPYDHWFWIPLTIALVMKPDFGSVFSRALLRIPGTVVGVALASIVLLIVPHGVGLGVVMGIFAFFVPWLMMRSYALQSLAISPIVILLVASIAPGDGGNYGWQRIAATVIGGAIVVIFGYLIWPHSRRDWAASTFDRAMDAVAEYLHAAASAVPDDPAAAALRHRALVQARETAGSTLLDLRTRLRRTLAEPPPADTTAAAWLPAVDAADRLVDAVTGYSVDRLADRAAPAPTEAESLAVWIRELSVTSSRSPHADTANARPSGSGAPSAGADGALNQVAEATAAVARAVPRH